MSPALKAPETDGNRRRKAELAWKKRCEETRCIGRPSRKRKPWRSEDVESYKETGRQSVGRQVRAKKQNVVLRCSPGCQPGGGVCGARSPAYILTGCPLYFAAGEIWHIGYIKK